MRGTEPTPSDGQRLHGFDAVRGLAAAAVVLLHAAYAHARFPLPGLVWPVPHDRPDAISDALFWATEGAVMPLFFTLSGYFLAASLGRRSPLDVLGNRTRRLLLPMASVGLAVLAIDFLVWAAGLILSGRATANDLRRMKFPSAIQAELFGPAHLWYVQYLWLMCVLVCGGVWLAGRLRRRPPLRISEPRAGRLVAAWRGLAAVLLIAVLLAFRPQIVLGFQHGWLPHPGKFLHGTLFLLLGALLFREPLLRTAVHRGTWLWIAAAAATFALLLPRVHTAMAAGRSASFNPVLGTLLAGYAVAATFASIAAGVRWLSHPNPRLSRLAEASFWIYVAHHPLLGLLTIALRPVGLPPAVETAVVTAATLSLCVWSYGRFVEGAAIGRLLDGVSPLCAFRPAAPVRRAQSQPDERRRAA